MQIAHELPLNLHAASNGSLIVFEEGSSPFSSRRAFVVTADAGQVRGHHAHKSCSQILAVLQGQVLVSVDNGSGPQEFLLSALENALLIPPMNWATQKYMSVGTILMVVCDQLFDDQDYIRDLGEFKANLDTIVE